MKKGILFALGVVCTCVTVASSAETLRIGTCGTGGYWYQSGTTLANMIDEHLDGHSGRALPTDCTVYNLNALASEQQELGMAVDAENVLAYRGEAQFQGGRTEGNVASVTTWYNNLLHIYTLDEDIESIEDLEGRRVAVGVSGGGTNSQATAVLEAAGLDPDEDLQAEEVNLETGVEQLEAGQIDAQFWLMPINNPTMNQLTSTRDVYLIPVGEELAGEIPAEQGMNLNVISAGTYPNQDQDVGAFSSSVNLMTHRDMDDDAIYGVLEMLYNNIEQFHGALPQTARDTNRDNAVAGLAIPMHPAARAFYEDNDFPGLEAFDARLERRGMSQ